MTATGAFLPDGRLHLHHGPIDLIIAAEGPASDAAFSAATRRFRTILDELVAELPILRRPLRTLPTSPVAIRTAHAVAPFTETFVTPMAAVAGSVADEICAVMMQAGAAKVHVNNGGDIAFHLTPGGEVRAIGPTGPILVRFTDPVRGIATSGWRGRSHSLGIADAVTVLAANAAIADAAATLIANAVDLPGHPEIVRQPALDIAPDSDLGDRLVTTNVGTLTDNDVAIALANGSARAQTFVDRGLIHAAALLLNGSTSVVGQIHHLTKDLAHA